MANEIGDMLRNAREAKNLSPEEAAHRLDVSKQAINQWETGTSNPVPGRALSISDLYGLDRWKLQNLLQEAQRIKYKKRSENIAKRNQEYIERPKGLDGIERNVELASEETSRQFERGPLARDVPELGVSVGGEDHDFSFNGNVERFVERPRGLSQAKKAFALIVVGDSMVPAYEEHTNIFVNPAKPPALNDYVVVEFFPEQEFIDDVSYPAGKALLKRLIARTAEHYVLKQYNPLLEFKIERKRVKQLWRVVPPNELLGFS